MLIDEINVPIFIAAFNVCQARLEALGLPYEELIVKLKRDVNLEYHLMLEVLSDIKK